MRAAQRRRRRRRRHRKHRRAPARTRRAPHPARRTGAATPRARRRGLALPARRPARPARHVRRAWGPRYARTYNITHHIAHRITAGTPTPDSIWSAPRATIRGVCPCRATSSYAVARVAHSHRRALICTFSHTQRAHAQVPYTPPRPHTLARVTCWRAGISYPVHMHDISQ